MYARLRGVKDNLHAKVVEDMMVAVMITDNADKQAMDLR